MKNSTSAKKYDKNEILVYYNYSKLSDTVQIVENQTQAWEVQVNFIFENNHKKKNPQLTFQGPSYLGKEDNI